MKNVPFILKASGWILIMCSLVEYPGKFWWAWLLGGFIIHGYAKFIVGPGRFDFWRLVGKFPLEAYYSFKENPDTWQIIDGDLPDDYRTQFPKDKWAGPYNLIVPEIGKIYIFGKSRIYEESQKTSSLQLGTNLVNEHEVCGIK